MNVRQTQTEQTAGPQARSGQTPDITAEKVFSAEKTSPADIESSASITSPAEKAFSADIKSPAGIASPARIEGRIQAVLDQVVNVQLQLHGGGASLSYYEDGVAWIKFLGACASCMSSSDTLELVVREAILEAVPEVKDVKLDVSVSQDLIDMARRILNGEKP